MKRGILVITTLLLLAGLLNKPAQASKLQVEINSDPPLCLPAAYPVEPVDCLPFGPSAYLTEMLRKGISYPFRSLPVQHPDPALQYATDSFLSVTSGSISMYTSLEDAISGNPVQTLGPGLMKYLAISQRVERSEGIFYALTSGLWVRAGDIDASCCIRSGRYQGLLMRENLPIHLGGLWIKSNRAQPRVIPHLKPTTSCTAKQSSRFMTYRPSITPSGT